jgi:hypothetical protein
VGGLGAGRGRNSEPRLSVVPWPAPPTWNGDQQAVGEHWALLLQQVHQCQHLGGHLVPSAMHICVSPAGVDCSRSNVPATAQGYFAQGGQGHHKVPRLAHRSP